MASIKELGIFMGASVEVVPNDAPDEVKAVAWVTKEVLGGRVQICEGTRVTGGDQDKINEAIDTLISSINDEPFNSGVLDSWVSLNHEKIQDEMVVTSLDGITTYDRDVDYSMDCASGMIQCLSTGAMPAATDYKISYDYGGGIISGIGEGIFWVNDSIIMKSHIELRNMTIKVIDGINANLYIIVNAHQDAWYVGDDHLAVKNIRLDGNKDNRVGGVQRGIYFKRVGYNSTFGCEVKGVVCENFQGSGIQIDTCRNSIVTGNACRRNSDGISVTSSNCVISKNECKNNTEDGIGLTNSDNNTVADNICQDNNARGIFLSSSDLNTVTGNVCQNNIGIYGGIDLLNSHYNAVTSNNCLNNGGTGINANSSDGNTITANVCKGNGYDGICIVGCDNNVISSNTCLENSQAADTAGAGICLSDSDFNLITSNLCRRGVGANQHGYGIDIYDATCDFNMIEGNNLYLSGRTGDFNNAGTNTKSRDNMDNAGAWLVDA